MPKLNIKNFKIKILFRRKTSDEWTKGTRSSIEQFSVATTSSGQGGSTMTAAVDLIPCRTNVSDELNLNKIEVKIFNNFILFLIKKSKT